MPSRRAPTSPPPGSPTSWAEVARKYAADVVEGKILACKLTQAACRRHLDDLARTDWPYRFDEDKAAKACRFLELLPHVKGDWAKRKELIKLEPFQALLVGSLFGWVHRETGLRRFRRAYVELPRKNTKSTTAAGIGLKLGAADGEMGAEVYCGATTEQQAWEVFRPLKQMVERTPELRRDLGIEPLAGVVVQERTGSRIAPVIGKPGDGASPHCAIVDEYHEHLTPDQYDTMLTGMGARSQPLMLVITTAGTDIEGPCYQLRRDVVDVLEGRVKDEEVFGLIYTIDEDDDWTSEAALWKANPNAGVSVSIDFLRSQQQQAIRNSARAATFKTKHLNVWVTARSPYFNLEAWRKCERSLPLDELAGQPCMVFLDLASKKDLAAMVAVFEKPHRVVSRFWLPEERAEEPGGERYAAWAADGHITLTPGNIIDFEFIEEELREFKSRVQIREVAYDPFQATQLATRMAAEGFPMVEFGAQVKNFSDPMKELDALILSGAIQHDGNPVQTWCMSNVTAKVDAKDNVFPRKERPESKIDGAVALIGALARWIHAEPAQVERVAISAW
jgi:phage terminase large subunit-like protein